MAIKVLIENLDFLMSDQLHDKIQNHLLLFGIAWHLNEFSSMYL